MVGTSNNSVLSSHQWHAQFNNSGFSIVAPLNLLARFRSSPALSSAGSPHLRRRPTSTNHLSSRNPRCRWVLQLGVAGADGRPALCSCYVLPSPRSLTRRISPDLLYSCCILKDLGFSGARSDASTSSVMATAAVNAAVWVVGKALAPFTGDLLEIWGASKELGTNIKELKLELLLVKVMLENARHKQLDGSALEELLQNLRDLASNAEDVLDELEYFRMQDKLYNTSDAVDKHAKGCAHNIVLNARHTAKAIGKLLPCSSAPSPGNPGEEDAGQRVLCCAWLRARQRIRGNSSSAPNANQLDEEVSGCMGKLGKLLPCSSFQPAQPQRNHAEETPKLEFNRVDISRRMMDIVKQLRPMREAVTQILQGCTHGTAPDITQSGHITTSESTEPKLYGRELTVNSIIRDVTVGEYCGKDLTVLPIFGVGGIGKTTLTQHIYHSQEVQNHFQVKVWICVSSLGFNPTKLIEEIKGRIPEVEGEEKEGTAGELIQQRLKSKRFLLILDDMWECSNEDDWKRLMLPFKKSQEMGSIILVTTRLQATAQMVKTTDYSIELGGLDTEEFRKLFLAFVFGDEQSSKDHIVLLETGDKIMEKLKGSPLAAKTVGGLLKNHLDLGHWTRVLESKEWEMQESKHDIMPALKLSYDNLPFHLQQCFSCCALFPEDYKFDSKKLIHFWIGLNILRSDGQNRKVEDIGQSNLDGLVSFGFFKKHDEEERNPYYTIHDLLHDLALKVASHECLSLHRSNVRSVEVKPSIRHLSIITYGAHDSDGSTHENFKSELRKLKTTLKIGNLQTLMVFGNLDESYAQIFGDLFREANALRILCLPSMPFPVESMLHNFSALVHLRYLLLKAWHGSEMHLPSSLSRFYHLRILDLEGWNGSLDLPGDISNLEKLCHFLTKHVELHSAISNVGKLQFLQELKKFQVGKESKGFEPKQLGHLRELRELGIYNLENIHTKETADQAKLIDKNRLHKLTLDWECNTEPDLEALVLESLQPHNCLEELCIRGHGGLFCPTWLGSELSVKALKSLHLVGVAWKNLPPLGQMWVLHELTLEGIATLREFGPNHFGLITEQSFRRLKRLTLKSLKRLEKWVAGETRQLFSGLQVLIIRDCPELLELPFMNNIHWLPNLREFKITGCPKVLSLPPIPWTPTLCSVEMRDARCPEKLNYSKFSSAAKLEIVRKPNEDSLEEKMLVFSNLTELQRLDINKGPPLELKHLQMLTSLKDLSVNGCKIVFGTLDDVELQLPIEHLRIWTCDANGKELTQLLSHLPKLSELTIRDSNKKTRLGVVAEKQHTTTPVPLPSSSAVEMEDTKATDQRQQIAGEAEEEEVVAVELVTEQEKEEDGLLLFPTHLSNSLQELSIFQCRKLSLIAPPTLPNGHKTGVGLGGEAGGIQALRSLQKLEIHDCPKLLSAYQTSFSASCCPFPSSLKDLFLRRVEGMETLEPLSNLTSLTRLEIVYCGEDLICVGLWALLTQGQLSKLIVHGCPKFFVGWDPMQGLQDEQELLPLAPSSKLLGLDTDDATGFLAAPIYSLLSSSLTKLAFFFDEVVERFTEEQEEALELLTSLQELQFCYCRKLQSLPAGLNKLTNLKRLKIFGCRAIGSLPEHGLPSSLQELDVSYCGNVELKQKCRLLRGTIPKIILD